MMFSFANTFVWLFWFLMAIQYFQYAALFSSVSMECTELLNTSLRDHLNIVWKRKHGKTFCGKISHQPFLVIQVILHQGPLGCTEHTLHYLDGQSLRKPSVFGPAEEHGSKNITPAMCDFMCHINGTSRYIHYSLKPYFSVKVAEG